MIRVSAEGDDVGFCPDYPHFLPRRHGFSRSRTAASKQSAMQLAQRYWILNRFALFGGVVLILNQPAPAVEVAQQTDSQVQTERESFTPAAGSDCFILGARSFTIPFTVDESGARPAEVRLYVARKGNDQWQVVAHQRPDAVQAQFEFTSPDDGEYWFATRTIDAAGNPHPNTEIAPQLKVFVDTSEPIVDWTVDANADGRIDWTLKITDATPIKELQVRYVTDTVRKWQSVDMRGWQAKSASHFSPDHPWQRISIQLLATDSAGNRAVVNRQLQRPRVAEAPANRYGNVAPSMKPAPFRRGTLQEPPVNQQVQYRGSGGGPLAQPFRSPLQQQVASPSAASGPSLLGNLPLPTANSPDTQRAPTPPGAADGIGLNGPQQSPSPTRPAEPEKIPTPKAEPEPPRTAAEAMRPLDEPSKVLPKKPERIPAPKPERTTRRRPETAPVSGAPIRYSDSERFSLEYELQAVGNLGVDSIELYGSVDGGETWKLWGNDPDRQSPFDIETKEEGVFSFCIVVVGRNGMASPRPLAGETPDIVVVVDKQQPQTRITAAQYGEGNRIGSLVIRYECLDRNLGPRPITLFFGDSPTGPWTTIAAGLKNDGQYVWPADPQLPRQIYLRLDAKDAAGNVGTFILDQPIDVQGLAPRARIRGFQSLSGMEMPPVDEQTARRPSGALK